MLEESQDAWASKRGGIGIERITTVEQWLGADNKLGIDIWNKKYRWNGESFEEHLERISGGDDAIKNLILDKKFLPGGRILSNFKTDGAKVTYSNCYVIEPPEDNIESIFDSRKKLARTYSYGGGCGIDISKLAPAGATVQNQARRTTGAVSFMEGYSKTTEEIGQNGRRGALMISMSCDHPDLPEFIDIKTKDGSVTKANISVRVTNDFMNAVVENRDWTMNFTRPETKETITKTVPAAKLFEKLCQNNWDWAEPGILFWDSIEQWNLLSNDENFKYAGVNPCAEEPLPAGGSCLLGSLNLSAFVLENKTFDCESFAEAVDAAVRYLNDVLEEGLPLHPLEEQRRTVSEWRQIGLGIMGLADMLIKLEIPYGSAPAVNLCSELAKMMADQAIYSSSQIAKKRGPYQKYTRAVMETPFFKTNASQYTEKAVRQFGLRNSQLLTIAPTGTISTMLGISGGIEPIFANSYTRKTESLHNEGEVSYKVYTPIVEAYMKKHGIDDEKDLPKWFVTSATIDPVSRVRMQGAWQRSIDASISSTVNLPEEATVEDVKQIYLEAWRSGLKGITIFRNGCKRAGILTTAEEADECDENRPAVNLGRGDIIQCDNGLVGKKRRLVTGCGTAHVSAWADPITGDVLETFVSKGSQGGCRCNQDAVSRLVSLAVRGGIPVESVVDQLLSCGGCDSYRARTVTKHDTSKGSSCPTAIGYALIDMAQEFKNECNCEVDELDEAPAAVKEDKPVNVTQTSQSSKCPECGADMRMEGGCDICVECGYSHCG